MTTLDALNWWQLDREHKRSALERCPMIGDASQATTVSGILQRVRDQGDSALLEMTLKFDKVELETIEVAAAAFEWAKTQVKPEALQAMKNAIARIRKFHEAQIPPDLEVETDDGVLCERISRPVQRVGLYVPAGTAPLPSAVLMMAIPAEIAGCPTRVLCSPPAANGLPDPHVLVAAELCGVQQVFAVGGAQAIAAMAYGTESIPSVDKIFGPGNSWVTEAKQQVSSDPEGASIDMPAGPSEVMVVADSTANAAFVVADLLSQAEHGSDSQAILVAMESVDIQTIQNELQTQLDALPRKDIATAALDHSRIIRVRGRDEALDVINAYAPEHLILQTAEPRQLMQGVQAAGSVFLGHYTPEALGDYCSGTNHVLPTYGYARAYSGLSLDQFITRITVQEVSAQGLANIGPDAMNLASIEGLMAHYRAVSIRMESK